MQILFILSHNPLEGPNYIVDPNNSAMLLSVQKIINHNTRSSFSSYGYTSLKLDTSDLTEVFINNLITNPGSRESNYTTQLLVKIYQRDIIMNIHQKSFLDIIQNCDIIKGKIYSNFSVTKFPGTSHLSLTRKDSPYDLAHNLTSSKASSLYISPSDLILFNYYKNMRGQVFLYCGKVYYRLSSSVVNSSILKVQSFYDSNTQGYYPFSNSWLYEFTNSKPKFAKHLGSSIETLQTLRLRAINAIQKRLNIQKARDPQPVQQDIMASTISSSIDSVPGIPKFI